MASTTQFWLDRITALDLTLAATEAALLAFMSNGAQLEYRFDSGQESVRVIRVPLEEMQDRIDAMINQREIYCQRAGLQSGTFYERGAW